MTEPVGYNLDAELAVLGSVLIDPRVFPEVREALRVEDFASTLNQEIYRAAAALDSAGKTIDPVTILEACRKAGALQGNEGTQYLMQLMEITPTAANVSAYIKLTREASMRRQLQEIARNIETESISHTSPREIIAASQKALQEIESNERASETIGFQDALADFLNLQLDIQNGVSLFTRTEYKSIDRILGGLILGGFYILAGRPGMGKTTLGLNIVKRLAERGLKVLVVSLEMSKEEITAKLVALESGLSSQRLLGKLDQNETDKMIDSVTKIRELPIMITKSPYAMVSDIRNIARGIPNLDIIVVDYVQLIMQENKKASKQEGMSQVSRDLKLVARELNIPVLGLSQLNRDVTGRTDKHPTIADLRDTGSWEQDADGIILLHRPDYYDQNYKRDGIAPVILEVDIAKNRHGPIGKVVLDYYMANGRIL